MQVAGWKQRRGELTSNDEISRHYQDHRGGWLVLGEYEGQPPEVSPPDEEGTVIVPAHGLGADVKIGLEKAILKQAGL